MRLYVRHPDGYGAPGKERAKIIDSLDEAWNMFDPCRELVEACILLHDGHAAVAVEIARELGWYVANRTDGKSWTTDIQPPDHALVLLRRSFDPDSGLPDDRGECEERAKHLWRYGIPVSVVPV